VVSGYCKSAGTLVALGAHELVFWEHGELGPLDVQMAKKDELWESQSGLTVTTALSALNEKAYSAFENFFLQTKYRGRGAITLRTASRMAVRLTIGLYGPIFAQIDPMHIGEAARSISIARQYGFRLNLKSHNLKRESLENLISGFVSHGFVIDRLEAADLFVNVRVTNDSEGAVLCTLGDKCIVPLDPEDNQTPIVDFISREIEETNVSGEQGQPVSKHREELGTREVLATAGGGPSGDGASTRS
jgi:hypothetical protein